MSQPSEAWGPWYSDLVYRNIGILTEDQQERLRTAKAVVFGMGGLGGTGFEILVRCGIGRFSIVDKDVFDATNMNRQIFAFGHTIGRRKIDVAEEWARAINPALEIEKFDHVDEGNVGAILEGADVAYLGIDQLKACLVISRKARELGVPLVEGWALPYGNVRTFTADTPSLEEAYGLPTQGRPIGGFTDEELHQLGLGVLFGLGRIEGMADFYGEEAQRRVLAGRIPSFAPMVWLTAVLMALETVKVVLHWGELALGPDFKLYDPFHQRIPACR